MKLRNINWPVVLVIATAVIIILAIAGFVLRSLK
jgi:hypothetical protein